VWLNSQFSALFIASGNDRTPRLNPLPQHFTGVAIVDSCVEELGAADGDLRNSTTAKPRSVATHSAPLDELDTADYPSR
jgi:hypothetical protein